MLGIYMNKLKIIRDNNLILTLKFKPPHKNYLESEGELDLMIDVGNGKYNFFDIVCLSTNEGFRQCLSKINAISWHGFYYKDNKEIKLPVIHFKEDGILKCSMRHTGIISVNEIFMFPICSFYLPQIMSRNKFKSIVSKSEDSIILRNDSSARIDIFVLPRFILLSDYMKSFSHSCLELLSDITIYDKSINCAIYNLPIDSEENRVINVFSLNEYSIIARTIYTNSTREGNLIKYFSTLFHDPNNVIDSIINRRFLIPEGNHIKSDFKSMRDNYNSEKNEFKNA